MVEIYTEFVDTLNKASENQLEYLAKTLKSGDVLLVSEALIDLGLTKYSIECLSNQNSKIYRVLKMGESEPFILKFEAWSMSETIKKRFEQNDKLKAALAPVYFNKKQIQIQPYCMGGTLESQAVIKMNDEDRISRALMLYRQVAAFYIELEKEQIIFSDGKPSNFTLDKYRKIHLTDMKNYRDVTPDMLASDPNLNSPHYPLYIPESPSLSPDKVHSRHFGINLYGYLSGSEWLDFYTNDFKTFDFKRVPKPTSTYTFSHSVFHSSDDGKALAELIKNMISDVPAQRPGMTDIQKVLKEMHQRYLKKSISTVFEQLRDFCTFYPEPEKREVSQYFSAIQEKFQHTRFLSGTELSVLINNLTTVIDKLRPTNDFCAIYSQLLLPRDANDLTELIRGLTADDPKERRSIEQTEKALNEMHQRRLEHLSTQALTKLEQISQSAPQNIQLHEYVLNTAKKLKASTLDDEAVKQLHKESTRILINITSTQYKTIEKNLLELKTICGQDSKKTNLKSHVLNMEQRLQDPMLDDLALKELLGHSTQIVKNLKSDHYKMLQEALEKLEPIYTNPPKNINLENYVKNIRAILQVPILDDNELDKFLAASNQILKYFEPNHNPTIQNELKELLKELVDLHGKERPKNANLGRYILNMRKTLQVPTFDDKSLKQLLDDLTQIVTYIKSPSYQNTLEAIVELYNILNAKKRSSTDSKLKDYLKDYIVRVKNNFDSFKFKDEELKALLKSLTSVSNNLKSDDYKAILTNIHELERISEDSPNDFELNNYVSKAEENLLNLMLDGGELKTLREKLSLVVSNFKSDDYKAILTNIHALERIYKDHPNDSELKSYVSTAKKTLNNLVLNGEELKQFLYESNDYKAIRKNIHELERIYKAHPNDSELRNYVLTAKKTLNNLVQKNEGLKQLLNDSNQIVSNLTSNEYVAITKAIKQFRETGTFKYFNILTWFNTEMLAMADVIESGLYLIPLKSRRNLFPNIDVNHIQQTLKKEPRFFKTAKVYDEDGNPINKVFHQLRDQSENISTGHDELNAKSVPPGQERPDRGGPK